MSDSNIPLNGHRPALPFACQGPTTAPEFYYGLTKREHFAGLAMQGILAEGDPGVEMTASEVADYATACADALLERLKR